MVILILSASQNSQNYLNNNKTISRMFYSDIVFILLRKLVNSFEVLKTILLLTVISVLLSVSALRFIGITQKVIVLLIIFLLVKLLPPFFLKRNLEFVILCQLQCS